MRTIQRLIYLSVLFQFLYTTAYSANYYVDKNANGLNNGTSWTNAWESFSAINWGSIQPGDNIYISGRDSGGANDSTVYYETLTPQCQGTINSRITIIVGKYSPSPSGHSGRVIIDGQAETRANSILFDDYAAGSPAYITIKGFELREATGGIEFNIDDVTPPLAIGIIIDSLYIYDWYDLAGIQVQGNTDGLIVQNCRIVTCLDCGDQTDCFHFNGTDTQHARKTIIRNCVILNKNQDPLAHNDAIQSVIADGFVIYNNIIVNDSVYSSEGGGLPFILGDVDYHYNQAIANRNPVILYNNFCYMGGVWYPNGNMGPTMWTRYYSDEAHQPLTYIINNTVVTNGPRVAGMAQEYKMHLVINNINAMYCLPDGTYGENWRSGSTHGWQTNFSANSGWSTAMPMDSVRHNLFWKQDNVQTLFTGGWAYSTGGTGGISGWSDWVSKGGTGINADPLFINHFGHEPDQSFLTGKITAGSPAIGAGENIQPYLDFFYNTWGIVLPATDRDGKYRDVTNPSIGAYEYATGGGNNSPNFPSNPNPANGAINQSVNLTLTWSCSDPDGDPLTYDVYFGLNNNPPLASGNQSNASFNPGQLNANTTYYWKIVAKDNQGANTSGSIWNFSTGAGSGGNNPPNPPSNPNPANGATDQSVNLVMTWSCTDPDGDPLTYDVYFGTSNNPSLVSSNQSNTSYDPGQLNISTTYYWKIVAKDNQGATTSGPVWSFSTENGGGGDFTPPELIGVQIVEADKVVLDFSEPLDESQVSNLGNYIISDQIQVLAAELNPTQTRICLTTDEHLVEHIYTTEIHNLTDLSGNVISSQANSAFYKKLDIGTPGYMEHLIEYVDASATTDTNTSPQKTLDGLVNGDPDPNSRWAAEIMPQWIQFDLGAIEDINLIAISFYQWNAGRIYEYSIQISNDEINWNEIVSNASSSSQAWTFNEFSPVLSARYIRIICESNNQANWAGVWEARIFEPDYPTTVETEPRTYALKQNYPNPFNPTTAIEYYVAQLSWVKLAVYNSIGQEVQILVDEEKASGLYEIDFNASNLTSGIYFYKLQSANFVETRKMVLLK